MNDINAISSDSRTIRRLDVETPLGVVHLAGFLQKPDHRSVILGILSEYVGEPVTAADILESKEDTRPKFPKLDFDVNWTHSDGYCVVAFGGRGSLGLRLGVDLERFSPRRLHLAERFFSTEEAALVKSLTALSGEFSEHAAEREFFRLWCRKEAFYKCVGGEFFEGTLRRNMLKNPVHLDAPDRSVYLVDLDGSAVGAPMKAALCLAVSA
ncbi:4'-phosphopantetheinyl transferase family protein [Fibrobacter sp.]|uniref:4'-phosphopantetheinyl transferase family protein n=1 Tax=Fibrobacter sp. TaxID=35828 RepID=UPI0025C2DE85|nr:4'-phosphopantetheinyl transferase superfamily protein [Fibrobacter sp.]MBS7271748.1 4'-phosphopantetheinyl transferase superfamily protein [Fibrobacter sp.]MDD7497126.1 4'-phosphopantetheinyl transferase superfamily protein [Fibrobacter sp.]MDY5725768.1 4'-phosphopantetheinyl transferase superfamily protein [Fibrobacter sp.]